MRGREERAEHIGLGVVVILLTVFAMSAADTLVKYVSADLPLWQIYVVRSLLVIPALTGFCMLRRPASTRSPAPALNPRAFRWVALRSLLLAMMYIFIYAAAPVLALPVIAAALYTGPLFIALLSALLIGEPVGRRRWLSILLGFLGVLVVIRPGSEAFSPLALIPVVAAFLYALANVLTRARCADESPVVLALALNFALIIVGLLATGLVALWRSNADQADIARAAAYPFLLGA